MTTELVLIVQWGLLALLTLALLAVWADVGDLKIVRSWSGSFRFAFGLALSAAMLGVLFAPAAFAPRSQPQEAVEADLRWRLASVPDRKQIQLETFKGKTLFVNMWATWCAPCVAELPSIEELSKRFQGRDDVAFLLVSIDDDQQKVADFLAERKITVPVYIALEPPPKLFTTSGIPATFIIGKEGRMEHVAVGMENWNRTTWVDLLDRLAKRPAIAKTNQ